jgi:hypothetical protein
MQGFGSLGQVQVAAGRFLNKTELVKVHIESGLWR